MICDTIPVDSPCQIRQVCTDTITVNQTIIDTVHRVVADSTAIKATEKALEVYNTSFVNMQSSFSNFLIAISIVTAILSLFIGALVLINFLSTNASKKEMKEKIKEFEDKVVKYEAAFLKMKGIEEKTESVYREICSIHLTSAVFNVSFWGKIPRLQAKTLV
ncbi:MAG: hypothetical protein LBU89_04860 [Fibromonadaceae bacterium]|jgi:hypothetical protein|nr:hypothetical protein [Fibromonadaceae bacterium]